MNTIYTDLYTKDTDTHNYLHYISAHPIHCKHGGPYWKFLRIHRNCTNMVDYEKHSTLSVKDYPLEVLLNANKKARTQDRKVLLKPNNPVWQSTQ